MSDNADRMIHQFLNTLQREGAREREWRQGQRPAREPFEYLDELRESGVTNMWGAGRYLQDEFGINKHVAGAFLVKWMKTFDERHPNG